MPALQAPFVYFGGKRRAAPFIWAALGDVENYIEPFCGSAAALLARPEVTGRRIETLNDADGWLVNTWRALQLSPEATARHAAGPVAEIDYHARLAWLQARRDADLVAWLEGDPEHHDPKAAGWWLYVVACAIGDPWEPGPWHVVDGMLRKPARPARQPGVQKNIPHLGNAGQGINRELPHLGDAGKGINRALPHLGDAGQGSEHEAQLVAYFRRFAKRLERVRITCGDWRRVLRPSVVRPGAVTTGILLDPPYSVGADNYATGCDQVAAEVRAWCQTADQALRIVLCGYDHEHDDLLANGWRKQQGRAGSSGYGVDRFQGRREKLWLSPACLGDTLQLGL